MIGLVSQFGKGDIGGILILPLPFLLSSAMISNGNYPSTGRAQEGTAYYNDMFRGEIKPLHFSLYSPFPWLVVMATLRQTNHRTVTTGASQNC